MYQDKVRGPFLGSDLRVLNGNFWDEIHQNQILIYFVLEKSDRALTFSPKSMT